MGEDKAAACWFCVVFVGTVPVDLQGFVLFLFVWRETSPDVISQFAKLRVCKVHMDFSKCQSY